MITAQELDTIGTALGKLPYENSAQLIANLHKQYTDQMKAKEEPVVWEWEKEKNAKK